LSGLLLGLTVLVWLTVEENSLPGVLIVSGLICSWVGIWLLLKTDSYNKHGLMRHVLIWGAAGTLLVPLAITLMAIKTAMHGHGTPDYSIEQMQAVLSRMPFFIIGGILVGAGSGLLRDAKTEQVQEMN
jgi:hypothetical protein